MINLVHLKDPDCFVHSDGTIWSYAHHHNNKNKTFRKIIPQEDKDGYWRVQVHGKLYRLNRLIALAFIPNPDNLPVVDHINRDRKDNRISNLRWASFKDNALNQNPALSGVISVRRHTDVKQYTKEFNSLSRKHQLMMRDENNELTSTGILTPEEYDILKPLTQKERYTLYHSWGKRKRHKLRSVSENV